MSEQIAAPVLSEKNSGILRGLSSLVLLVACLTLTGCSGGSQPSGDKGSHSQSGGSATDTGGTPKKLGARLMKERKGGEKGEEKKGSDTMNTGLA
jgi:hypothetical protein